MDLVAGVRKEGSRGGRADFKWEDVQSDQHRENYLGHSLMAPVGRWQKNRDLSWYAKSTSTAPSGTTSAAETAAQQRVDEIRMIKEAERDALSAALGFAVAPRLGGAPGVEKGEVERVVREMAGEDDVGEGEQGVGFGGYVGREGEREGEGREVLRGVGGRAEAEGGGLVGGEGKKEGVREREREREKGRERRHHRSRSRERRRRRKGDGDERHGGRGHARRRSVSRSRSRSRDGDRGRDGERRRASYRSRSPHRDRDRDRDRDQRRRRHDDREHDRRR